jgi:hypothetical protein
MARLVIGLVAAAVFAGSALAGADDPKKRHNPADQAWARAIRIHRFDLPGTGWRAQRTKDDSGYAPRGCRNPDLSDLVATGEATNPDYVRGGSFVGSGSTVFATERQATTAWSRTARIRLSHCLVAALRDGIGSSGVSITTRSSETARSGLAPHELGARVRFSISGPAAKINGRIAYYIFARGRAVGAVMVISLGRPLQPVPLALEQKLARLVASRLRR